MRLDPRLLSQDLYALLGVSPSAPSAEIRRAWRRLALRWHPDRRPDDARAAEERMKRLNVAASVLLDASRRSWYDAGRAVRARRPAPEPRASWTEPPRPAPAPVDPSPPFAWRWEPPPFDPYPDPPPRPRRRWESFSVLVLALGLTVVMARLATPFVRAEPSMIPAVGEDHIAFDSDVVTAHRAFDLASFHYPTLTGSTVVPVTRAPLPPWPLRPSWHPPHASSHRSAAAQPVAQPASAPAPVVKPPNANKL